MSSQLRQEVEKLELHKITCGENCELPEPCDCKATDALLSLIHSREKKIVEGLRQVIETNIPVVACEHTVKAFDSVGLSRKNLLKSFDFALLSLLGEGRDQK